MNRIRSNSAIGYNTTAIYVDSHDRKRSRDQQPYNPYLRTDTYNPKRNSRDSISPSSSDMVICQSLNASSGSLSSSVSLSDRSVSTDCVEEFIGDAPFAGKLNKQILRFIQQ